MKPFGSVMFMALMFVNWANGYENMNMTELLDNYSDAKYGISGRPLMVGLTLIYGAAAKGAGRESAGFDFAFSIFEFKRLLLLFLCRLLKNF